MKKYSDDIKQAEAKRIFFKLDEAIGKVTNYGDFLVEYQKIKEESL